MGKYKISRKNKREDKVNNWEKKQDTQNRKIKEMEDLENKKNELLKRLKNEKKIKIGLKYFSIFGVILIVALFMLKEPPIAKVRSCQDEVNYLLGKDGYKVYVKTSDERLLESLSKSAKTESEPGDKNYQLNLNMSMFASTAEGFQRDMIKLKVDYDNELKISSKALSHYLSNSKHPKSPNVKFQYLDEDCDLSYFKNNYKDKIDEAAKEVANAESNITRAKFEISRQNALEQVDRDNAEIDNAQNQVISDFRKRAIRTYATTGAGNVRVEAFVLKGGRTVYCSTIIGDSGKAVDCHE